jgi:hypothetical protein
MSPSQPPLPHVSSTRQDMHCALHKRRRLELRLEQPSTSPWDCEIEKDRRAPNKSCQSLAGCRHRPFSSLSLPSRLASPSSIPKAKSSCPEQPLILTLEPEEATDGHRLLIGFVIGVIMPLSLWVSVSSTPMDTLKTSSAPASSPSAALQPAEEAARAHTNSYHVQSWSQVVQIKSLQHRHNNIHK